MSFPLVPLVPKLCLLLEPLHELGIRFPVVLWMLYQAHVEHLYLGRRHPRPVDSLRVNERSGFVLTDNGRSFAENFLAAVLLPEDDQELIETWSQLRLGRLTPRYDKDERVFWWGRHELKRFKQPAEHQELVLLAAEEQGWPEWFDDPLPRERGTNSKARLHDTINALNRNQKRYFIHFKGDGTGRRFGWEYHQGR